MRFIPRERGKELERIPSPVLRGRVGRGQQADAFFPSEPSYPNFASIALLRRPARITPVWKRRKAMSPIQTKSARTIA